MANDNHAKFTPNSNECDFPESKPHVENGISNGSETQELEIIERTINSREPNNINQMFSLFDEDVESNNS